MLLAQRRVTTSSFNSTQQPQHTRPGSSPSSSKLVTAARAGCMCGSRPAHSHSPHWQARSNRNRNSCSSNSVVVQLGASARSNSSSRSQLLLAANGPLSH